MGQKHIKALASEPHILWAQSKDPVGPTYVPCISPRLSQMCGEACLHQPERHSDNANICVDPGSPTESTGKPLLSMPSLASAGKVEGNRAEEGHSGGRGSLGGGGA